MSAIEDRLTELGLRLPEPPAAPPGVRLPFAFVRVHGDSPTSPATGRSMATATASRPGSRPSAS